MRERKRVFKPKMLVGLAVLIVMSVGMSMTVLANSTVIKNYDTSHSCNPMIGYQLEERQGQGTAELLDCVNTAYPTITLKMEDDSIRTFNVDWHNGENSTYESSKDSFESNDLDEYNGKYSYTFYMTGDVDLEGCTIDTNFNPQREEMYGSYKGLHKDGTQLKLYALGHLMSHHTRGYAERRLNEIAEKSSGIAVNVNTGSDRMVFKDESNNLIMFTDIKIKRDDITNPAQEVIEAVNQANLQNKTVKYMDVDVVKKSNNNSKLNVVGDGLPLVLSYPSGTNSSYNFYLKHWNASTSTLENVSITKSSSGIQFRQSDFSPFVLAYDGGNQPVVEEKKEEKKEETQSSSKTPPETNPSVLTVGTVSTGGLGLKVLNTDTKGQNNHKMLASWFGGQYHKGKTCTIVSTYDVYSPFSITADWKNAKRTIDWKVSGAKAGDTYFVVYYNQSVGMVQYLPCTVKDGMVTFTVPKMGDVSTISIVKVN